MVVGPEAPLVAGLVDALSAAASAAFGPTRAAARIEGFEGLRQGADARLWRADRRARDVRDRDEPAAHIACASYPAVLKADVLAAGKE